jgi:hypothetical protein
MMSRPDLRLRLQAALGEIELTAHTGSIRVGRWRWPEAGLLEPARDLRAMLDTPQARMAPMRMAMQWLGRTLLEPLTGSIDQAGGIVLHLAPSLLDMPIELLPHRGRPLGMQRPILVQVDALQACGAAPAPCDSGYFLSNRETDPDRACLDVARRFARFSVHEEREISPRAVARLAPHDVVVCSLHGQVQPGSDDHMRMAAGRLRPGHLAGLRPQLLYLDACRLGLSLAWLEAMRALGTRHLIAPIANNEGGRSSGATMTGFFDHWLGGDPPARALCRTRRELWDACKDDDPWHRLWRSSVFRAYRLN